MLHPEYRQSSTPDSSVSENNENKKIRHSSCHGSIVGHGSYFSQGSRPRSVVQLLSTGATCTFTCECELA